MLQNLDVFPNVSHNNRDQSQASFVDFDVGTYVHRRTKLFLFGSIPEGYRFNPPLQETFFKDDANHDPQWSDEQIISAGFQMGGRKITKDEVDIMKRTTVTVFEILERAWTVANSSLIDMKVEFGVDTSGEILLADIIDSDSWRLWPAGDKKQMKDKQVYRDLSNVTQQNLETVKRNFKWVEEQLDYIIEAPAPLVVIFMGSPSDQDHCSKIQEHAKTLGLKTQLRTCSAHKGTAETLNILAEYEGSGENVVLIAVAGRSNGLGPVLSGNTVLPVINSPPLRSDNIERSVWSSLDVQDSAVRQSCIQKQLHLRRRKFMRCTITWFGLVYEQSNSTTSLI